MVRGCNLVERCSRCVWVYRRPLVKPLVCVRFPSTIIVSLEGSIIEKARLLFSGVGIVVVNNIPRRARTSLEMVRRITGHYRDVSSQPASFTGTIMGKMNNTRSGQHLEALTCATRLKWKTIINDSILLTRLLSSAKHNATFFPL